MEVVRLYGGPLDGTVVAVPDGATQLKVVRQVDVERIWELPPDAKIETVTEFYIFTGFSGRLDYQPHPH